MATDYRQIAAQKAQKYGLDPHIFERQISQESGFNPHAVSPAGARGIAQITPGTARAWGVNPSDPVASLDAAARNMAHYVEKYGSYDAALRAYNAGEGAIKASHGFAETNAYVSKILRGRDPGGLASPARAAGAFGASPALAPPVAAAQDSGGAALTALLTQMQAPAPQRVSMGLAAPSFSAGPALPAGAQLVASGGAPQPQSPGASLAQALAAVKQLPGITLPAASSDGTAVPQAATAAAGGGRVKITGPDPGRIKPAVLKFARKISAILGEPIVGSDGSGHSRLTVDGNVSQHSTGNATDIPASGQDLIRKGRAALVAAGMDPAKARKQTGGLFNFPHGVQVIFNTHIGGDHTNHLHISHG